MQRLEALGIHPKKRVFWNTVSPSSWNTPSSGEKAFSPTTAPWWWTPPPTRGEAPRTSSWCGSRRWKGRSGGER